MSNKAKENKITFPAIKKKLAEFKRKYPSDYSQIDIHLKQAELKWWTIDEEQEKERLMDGNYLLKTNRLLHSIELTLRQAADRSRWVTIKRLVSTHNYSTIQLPTTNGTVINVRKAGMPEGVQIEIYKKLGVDFENLPVRQSLA